MKSRAFLFVMVVAAACGDPVVSTGTGGGSSGSASTAADSSGSTATSSSGPVEGSTGLPPTSTSSEGSGGSSSSGEVLEGPGCEPPPPCDRGAFDGSLRIESSEQIADIAGYTEILGGLEVVSTDLECLDFLGCLEDVGRDIRIFGNEDLRSTDGLSEVKRLGLLSADRSPFYEEGSVIISENPRLETLGGFAQVTRLERSLLVTNNESLRSIEGFTGLEVAAELVIRFNPTLESLLGLHELIALGNECQITNNGALCVSEAFEVCGDLAEGPSGGNTQNNLDDC